MNVYLYPAPNKKSRFFDEYYSALLQKKDNEITVKILEPTSKFERIFFSFINRLARYFPWFAAMGINYLLKNDNDVQGGGG